MMKHLLIVAWSLFATDMLLAESVRVDFSGRDPNSRVTVSRDDDRLVVTWPIDEAGRRGHVHLSLTDPKSLIRNLSLSTDHGDVVVLRDAATHFQLFVGQRKRNPRGDHTFFDRVDERDYKATPLTLTPDLVVVDSAPHRARIRFHGLKGDDFSGELRFTFFAGTALIQIEAVVSTDQPDRAILYQAGLASSSSQIKNVVYHQAGGSLETVRQSLVVPHRPWKIRSIGKRKGMGQPEFDPNNTPLIGRAEDGIFKARYRTIAMETESGAVALFPTPHKFLYPLDFAENVGFNFAWKRDDRVEVGVRQPPLGDGRFRPWVDCPPGSRQHLDLFLLPSTKKGAPLIAEVARFTRGDRYQHLEGFRTFSSHYHMWHTRELIEAQQRTLSDNIPADFERPLFVEKMKQTGMEIVHLAEFHGGPRTGKSRLEELKVLHRECDRLSDAEILFLPGEEPNVHLGGHWVSLFPKPVYWDFINRETSIELKQRIKKGDRPPFQQEDPELGAVYFVNSAEDVQRLFEKENGLYWTAHPRIKGSTGFPDLYREEAFFKSHHFLGGAWKAMPANYAHERLGERVLDLLDDMNQWGAEKQILGEADLFQLNAASELFGHANVNYLKLDRLPRFRDGWSEVLEALRNRQYFTTTGEVLIPSFKLNGQEFPEQISLAASEHVRVEIEVMGTFPLAFAEVISGDGREIFRERVDLTNQPPFAKATIRHEVNLAGRHWVRVEAWDVAENGAFTQPALLKP